MGLHKRSALAGVLGDISKGAARQVYLLFGERYLCQQAAGQIEQALLANGAGAVHQIDGSTEDNARILSRVLSFSLLPGNQVYRVVDTRLFLSRDVGSSIWDKAARAYQNGQPESAARLLGSLLNMTGTGGREAVGLADLTPDQWQTLFGFARPAQDVSWADRLLEQYRPAGGAADDSVDKLTAAIEKGLPKSNYLLLMSETVDKRKKLFATIKAFGEIVDCSVADGPAKAAQQEQKDVVRGLAADTLTRYGKTMDAKVLEQLFDRIGFHPVAVVMEVEKLCLYVADRPRINSADLDLMVGRTREDAIFELSEALAEKNRPRALIVLNHLLGDGVHGLAIIASLRNFLRRLLIFKALQLQAEPAWYPQMNATEFQNHYLPALKESGAWPEMLKGHPYALYMSFIRAATFSVTGLKRSLGKLLEAEFKLKGAPLPPRLVLEELLLSLIESEGGATARSASR